MSKAIPTKTTPPASLSLLVPVAAWPSPPHHEVTALCPTRHARSALATGSSNGHLCLWSVDEAHEEASSSLRLTPRAILLGHSAPIVWIASCLFERSEALVSLCSGGLLNVWDPMDGRCLSSSAAPVLPVATVGSLLPQLSHVVVGGESNVLVVVQIATMSVRCVLSPLDDWCALRQPARARGHSAPVSILTQHDHALCRCLALAAMGGSEQRTRLVCLTASSVRAWTLSIEAGGAVVAGAPALSCALPPPPPLPLVAPSSPGRVLSARERAALEAITSGRTVTAARRKPKRQAYDDEPVYEYIGKSIGEIEEQAAAEAAEKAAEEAAAAAASSVILPLVAFRSVMMSADGLWLLLLGPDGTLAVYVLDARMRSDPPSAVAAEPLATPMATSATPQGSDVAAAPSAAPLAAAPLAAAPSAATPTAVMPLTPLDHPSRLASCAALSDRDSSAAPTPVHVRAPPAVAPDGPVPPPRLRLLLRPRSSGSEDGWEGGRLVRHGTEWAVLAWSHAAPPSLFLLPRAPAGASIHAHEHAPTPAPAATGAPPAATGAPPAATGAPPAATGAPPATGTHTGLGEEPGGAEAVGDYIEHQELDPSSPPPPPSSPAFTCASAVAAQWLRTLLPEPIGMPARTAARPQSVSNLESLAAAHLGAPSSSPLPMSPREAGAPRSYALVVADAHGSLHVLAERDQGTGGQLEHLGHAPLRRGWPERAQGEPAVSSSWYVPEGVQPQPLAPRCLSPAVRDRLSWAASSLRKGCLRCC